MRLPEGQNVLRHVYPFRHRVTDRHWTTAKTELCRASRGWKGKNLQSRTLFSAEKYFKAARLGHWLCGSVHCRFCRGDR